MDLTNQIVIAHAFATIALAGLIWFVQVVHYPLMARVGSEEFSAYASEHVRRTTLVVAPLMLAELAAASWLALWPPVPQVIWATTVGFLLLIVVWLSTAVLQVPCHRQLERGLDPLRVRRLVTTNWVRTLAWTARAASALYLVVEVC
jgi:hypothetical protein